MLLIFPAERKINWSKPPLATLGLIVINVLVFFIFQADEDDNYNNAIDYYLNSPLVSLEYSKYYQFRNPQASTKAIQNLTISGDDISQLIMDDDWSALIEKGLYPTSSVEHSNWLEYRQQFESLLSNVTSYGKGLRPAKPSLLTNFTHMFLHGDGFHLLGNMVFLLIFGFSLEIIFGVFKYLGLYLLSGIGAGIFYTLINSQSYIPLIGASGAISGLMGCYAVVYGFRRIQFFFWFVSYFNYIKLPALIVLPVWLMKEVWEYLNNPGSNVAYMAHVGGLMAGALVGFIIKHQTTIDKEYIEGSDEEDSRDPIAEDLEAALEAMRRLNFSKAQTLLHKIIRLQPANIRALELLYYVEKIKPKQSSFKRVVEQIFEVTRNERDLDDWVHQIYDEFRRLNPQGGLSVKRLVELCRRFSRSGHTADAEAIIELLEGARPDTPELPEIIFNLGNYYLRKNQRIKARDWLLKLENQYQHHSVSAHATVMLNKIDKNRDI